MSIVSSQADVLQIRDLPDLDRITVVFLDYGDGAGLLLVECFGEAWASYWNAMGCGLREFVAKVDVGYLAQNLWPREERRTRRREEYLRRIVVAVKEAIRERAQ